jgi:hypothetical protein
MIARAMFVRFVRIGSINIHGLTICSGNNSLYYYVAETRAVLIRARHVRVHHVDKDKDDPALRDVLAQRPAPTSHRRRRRISDSVITTLPDKATQPAYSHQDRGLRGVLAGEGLAMESGIHKSSKSTPRMFITHTISQDATGDCKSRVLARFATKRRTTLPRLDESASRNLSQPASRLGNPRGFNADISYNIKKKTAVPAHIKDVDLFSTKRDTDKRNPAFLALRSPGWRQKRLSIPSLARWSWG